MNICLECGVTDKDHHLVKTHRFRSTFEMFEPVQQIPVFVPPKVESDLDVCKICHNLRQEHQYEQHDFQTDPFGQDDLCLCGMSRRCHAPFHTLVNHAFQYETLDKKQSRLLDEAFCRTCGIPKSQHDGMVHSFR